jgi:hypothetical protein
VVSKSYEIHGSFFGIRTNSEACAAWLDESLGRYEVTDEEADPFYSLWIATEGGLGKRFHLLYKESLELVRAFDLTTLGLALLSELEGFAVADRDDAIYADAALVSRSGVNALIPSPLLPWFRTLGRTVERELTLPVAPIVAIDPSSARVEAAQPTLDIPADALERLATIVPGNPEAPRASVGESGDVDVFCTFHYDAEAENIELLSHGFALYNLARLTRNLGRIPGSLGTLSRLLREARCYQLQDATPRQSLDTLISVMAEEEVSALEVAG